MHSFCIMETKKVVLYATVGVFSLYVGAKTLKRYIRNCRLRKAIKKRNQQRNDSFEQLRAKLDLASSEVVENRKRITSLSLESLLIELREGEVRPIEALEAFQWRAIQANDVTNCVCQFIVEASDWALQLEVQYSNSKEKPALYGLPFSIKESIHLTGYDSTRGYAQFIDKPVDHDCNVVKILRQAGAIPFVQTNVPQSLLSFNCSNPVYGQTSNPLDPRRTCGGSSGGEAALIAMGGSLLGIGSDVGGSIRMPAHYCGVAGFKPSHLRITQRGSAGSVPGRPMINASIGPMGADVETLAIFMKSMLCDQMYAMDSYVAPIRWRPDMFEGTSGLLTIGYYDYDGFMPATPACKRAVHMAKEVLEKAGHTLVRFDPPDVTAAFEMFIGAATVDGGQYLVNLMKNDIVDPYYSYKVRLYSIPIWFKRLVHPALNYVSPDFGMAFRALSLDTAQLRSCYEKITKYRERFESEFRRLGLDAVLCPAQASTALSHEYPEKTAGVVSYCALFNVLDYAAGVIPVTNVTTEDERRMGQEYKPNRLYAKYVKEDSSANTVGLPIGVQCAAPPFQEEICLRVLRDIEAGLEDNSF